MKWIDKKKKLPKSGQLIKCRIKDEDGFVGSAKYIKSKGAVTVVEFRNRTVETIWKFDEWMPIDEQ